MMSNMEPTLNLQSESTTREADVDKEPHHETDEDTAHSSSSSAKGWLAYSYGVVVGDKLHVESSGWELAGEDSSSRASTVTVQHSVMDIPTTSCEIETSCIKTRDWKKPPPASPESQQSRAFKAFRAYKAFRDLGCEYCGKWFDGEIPPFRHCNYCLESPSFHHGRCCPWKEAMV